MAELDLTYYHGDDRYSDGDEIENRLMEIVRDQKTVDELSLEEVSWPILYHLHPVRENICNWYPFRKGSRILEIGAGCGAVTGALCRSECEVYSIDLSQRRSGINYEQHKAYDHLHIIVGNLNDMAFDESFDYIALIGVLEYAGQFTEGETPYRTFLENIRKLMKPDGRLLIAIENRLGLKYFAGTKEDHLGKPFAGINGYCLDEGVRTFSRTELRELLNQSGFSQTRFYYPYPDYKFPLEIFSEEETASGRYGKAYYPVDEPRQVLFSEPKVTQALKAEGIAGLFANSFFVEASTETLADSQRILYVKLNNDRKERFRIGTVIRKDGENTEIIKYPLNEKAEAHIRTIWENEKRIGGNGNVLRGKETSEGLSYPYISDPTAEMILEKLVKNNDREGTFRLLDDVFRLVALHSEEKNYCSEKFTEWFGGERTEKVTMPCVTPANIDMILDNIFLQGDEYTVLDCEWVTDFPVPLAFVMWRTLESARHYHPELEKIATREELFARYQIAPEDEPVYFAWSAHFETDYVGNNSLSRFSKGIRIVEFDPELAEYREARIRQLEQAESEYQKQIRKAGKTEEELRQQIFNQKKTTDELKWQVEYGTARIRQLEQAESEYQEQIRKAGKTEEELRQQIFNQEKTADELKWQVEYGTARIQQLEQAEGDYQEQIRKAGETEAEMRRQIFDQGKTTDELKWQVEYGTARIGQLEETEKTLRKMNAMLEETETRLNGELQSIYNSNGWKMIVKFRQIAGVFRHPGKK